jgi:DNA-directed RNA polymerase subunit RPC12/RpoP
MDEQRGNPDPGTGSDAGSPGDREGVLTLVCFTCGREYYFDQAPPPPDLSCEKCGSTVFRDFFSPAEDDEAARDFVDSTARDLDPDDAEGDVLPGDVMDLDRA